MNILNISSYDFSGEDKASCVAAFVPVPGEDYRITLNTPHGSHTVLYDGGSDLASLVSSLLEKATVEHMREREWKKCKWTGGMTDDICGFTIRIILPKKAGDLYSWSVADATIVASEFTTYLAFGNSETLEGAYLETVRAIAGIIKRLSAVLRDMSGVCGSGTVRP